MTQTYYSHGKLLLTGEYLVMDGLNALAVPTKFGQNLTVTASKSGEIKWEAYAIDGSLWAAFSIPLAALAIKDSNKPENPRAQIIQILGAAQTLNPEFLHESQGAVVKTQLEFPENWGLGSSSTLLHNMAQWAQVNPYALLEKSMGGSGYDIACGHAQGPITYKRDLAGFTPEIQTVSIPQSIRKQMLFVHLNKKQNSRAGIAHYQKQKTAQTALWLETLEKTKIACTDMLQAKDIGPFMSAMQCHEATLAKFLNLTPVGTLYFSDFKGQLKSLGAWGGDFVMAVSKDMSESKMKSYFAAKGFNTALSYHEMVL